MPYVTQTLRDEIDEEIIHLVRRLKVLAQDKQRAGVLNYTITQILTTFYQLPHKQSYAVYNELVGVLESCKLEFYSTFVSAYEELKSQENGPIVGLNL